VPSSDRASAPCGRSAPTPSAPGAGGEPPLWTVLTDPEHVLRFAWRNFGRNRVRMLELLTAPQAPPVVRLRSRREVRHWLAAVVE
jgi:hypothetical protein